MIPIKKKREALFIVGVVIYLIVLIINSIKLAPASREFPSVIIGAAFVIIGLKFLTYIFPRLKFLDPSSSMATLQRRQEEPQQPQEDTSAIPPSVFKPGAFIIWLATFPLGAYILGFLPAIFSWLFLFLMLLAKVRLRLAVTICACMFLAVYLVFIFTLEVRFPTGILF